MQLNLLSSPSRRRALALTLLLLGGLRLVMRNVFLGEWMPLPPAVRGVRGVPHRVEGAQERPRVVVYGAGSAGTLTSKVLVVAGMRAGNLQMATRDLGQAYAQSPMAASGSTLVLAGYSPPSIAVLETADLGNLSYVNKGDVASYVYQVTLDEGRALCAMGPYGLAVVDLDN